MTAYYERSFPRDAEHFSAVLAALPDDAVAKMLLERCQRYAKNPPPPTWDGVEVMTHK
jgi:hypothetical protein